MAAPTIADITTSTQATDSTTNTFNYPATVNSGDLLVAITASDQSRSTISWPAGWNSISDGTANDIGSCAWLDADGTETGTFEVTLGAAQRSVCTIYRLTGAEPGATTPPEIQAINLFDPSAITPTGGAKDYLIITTLGANNAPTVTTYPSGYTNTGNNNSGGTGSGHASLSYCSKALTAATTEDPGAWTMSAGDTRDTFTIAVYPEDTSPKVVAAPNPLVDGATSQSMTVANFGGDLTFIRLRSKENNTHIVDLSFSGSGTSYTFSAPDFGSNTNVSGIAGCPFTSDGGYDNLEYYIGDGTDTATYDVVFNPATNYTQVKTSPFPSTAEGSIYENYTGFYDAISAVSQANPASLALADTSDWVASQDVTLVGFTTDADINGERVITISDGTHVTVPVNTITSVTDGVGTMLTGKANEHGQVLAPPNVTINAIGEIAHAETSNFYYQYFDYVDSKWKAVLVVVTKGAGSVNQPIINFPWLWD